MLRFLLEEKFFLQKYFKEDFFISDLFIDTRVSNSGSVQPSINVLYVFLDNFLKILLKFNLT